MRFWSQNFTEGASPRYRWFSALRPLRILEQIGPLVGQRLVPPCRAFNRWRSVALSADRNVARNRAYEIYLRRGGQHGCELEDWLQAERELTTIQSALGVAPEHGAGSNDGPLHHSRTFSRAMPADGLLDQVLAEPPSQWTGAQ